MRKGITPVIALVMLMLITVGMVGIAYTWFSGLLTTQTEKGISIPPGGAYCTGGKVSVLVQNNGATSTITKADIIIAQVDGTDVTEVIDANPNDGTKVDNGKWPLGDGTDYPAIQPGSGSIFISQWKCTTECASGSRNIRIGTRTGVVESSAYCK